MNQYELDAPEADEYDQHQNYGPSQIVDNFEIGYGEEDDEGYGEGN